MVPFSSTETEPQDVTWAPATPREPAFDAACRVAERLFGMPLALVSLLEADRRHFEVCSGSEVQHVSLDVAFCSHTILSDDVMVVEDTASDPRFADNPHVAGMHRIRFYAGAPLVLADGVRVGALSVMDFTPRTFSADDRAALQDLATGIVATLRLRHANSRRAAQESARAVSEIRYRTLAEALPHKVWVTRTDGTALYVNERMRAYHGLDPTTFAARVGLQHPRDMARLAQIRNEAVAVGAPYEAEARLRRHDGVYRWHRITMNPIRTDATGAVTEWIGTSLDIHDIISAQERLMETTQLLQLAQEAAEAGSFEWNATRRVGRLSGESGRLLGIDNIEAVSFEDFTARVDPLDHAAIERATADAVERGEPYRVEFRVNRPDGGVRWIMAVGRLERDPETGDDRILGLNIDITARKEAERRAERMARHDALTDLPNRTLFRETLDRAMTAAREQGESVALLCLDLDRFKAVNDTLGHPVGDALLRAVAGRLAGQIRDGDLLARIGGDEFAVLQVGAPQPDAARLLAQRLLGCLSTPVSVGERDLSVGLSIGVALAPNDARDADTLFKNADLALYRAKQEGRGSARFFEAAMDAAVRARQELEVDLREAVAREELDVHFQPALDLETGTITGFEALLRWTHPVHGPIGPDRFIPIAEETRLIVPIGDFVLRRACAVAATWPDPIRVAVNVSAVQFESTDLPARVSAALAATGLSPERLELEITETVLVRDAEQVLRTLSALRALGVRIALDDFGTGYSSLSYLRRFGFDRLKIDRSFIRDMHDPDTAAIVRAMVGLGAHLGIAITAEGIETPEQLERVRAEGCSEAQGFLIGRPAPADELRRWLPDSVRAA